MYHSSYYRAGAWGWGWAGAWGWGAGRPSKVLGRPTSRERARPQPPVPGRQPPARSTEERQRSQPRCRSGPLATEPSGPEAKLDPPDHTQPIPAPPWTQGAPGGVTFPLLASLIAQLVTSTTAQQQPGGTFSLQPLRRTSQILSETRSAAAGAWTACCPERAACCIYDLDSGLKSDCRSCSC
jgi:hypothetical protein